MAVYRIAPEASVPVTLRVLTGELRLTVKGDGQDFDTFNDRRQMPWPY